LFERFHEELLWYFHEHHFPKGDDAYRPAIEGEAMISLGAKAVLQAQSMYLF
jgi:hypothetical protein